MEDLLVLFADLLQQLPTPRAWRRRRFEAREIIAREGEPGRTPLSAGDWRSAGNRADEIIIYIRFIIQIVIYYI
jgi:hypothetical protein